MMAEILDFNDAAILDEKPITIALGYAARGWPVFPCNPVNKRPLVEHGFKEATTDAFKVRSWWARWPNAMIGIPTGAASGFWVQDIDTDKTKNKDGIASLAANGHDLNELMDTVVAVTASGGYHALYRFDPERPVGVGQNKPWRDLDIRGEGGYIIAAGSTRADGRRYTWLNPPAENEIADAPEWLLEALGNATPDYTSLDFNSAPRASVPPAERVAAIQPGTWHENTRDIVARMVREGASDDTIAALAPRFTEPGYSVAQTIQEFLTHARTARAKWGYQPKNLEAEQAEKDNSAPRFKILSIAELMNVKPPEWRIDGIFPTHGSSVLYGAYETFKTFIALDMTLSLATGLDWQGRASKTCSVLYVAGEGQVGLGIRAAGWLSAKGISQADARFQALPEAIALPNAGDQDDLLRAIDGMADHPDVIVFDTVTRMTGGGSLNDEKDAQGYVRGVDRVRMATGAHIMNIGHSGKEKERGILGSTVLPAAMETIICVERKGTGLTLINANPKGKQKDGPNFDDIPLKTRIVDFDHHGQALKTVVLEADEAPQDESDNDRSAVSTKPRGANQQAVMAALKKAKGEPLGLMRLMSMTGLDNSKVFQALPPLVAKGLVEQVGEEGAKRWILS